MYWRPSARRLVVAKGVCERLAAPIAEALAAVHVCWRLPHDPEPTHKGYIASALVDAEKSR